jgi:hypothetical protein
MPRPLPFSGRSGAGGSQSSKTGAVVSNWLTALDTLLVYLTPVRCANPLSYMPFFFDT